MDLLELIMKESGYTYHRAVGGGEYKGPCPFCKEGNDRFCIWPTREKPGYWCRRCEAKGDAIQFCRNYLGMGYQQAKEYLDMFDDSGVHLNHHYHHNHHNDLYHHNHHSQPQNLTSPGATWSNRAWDWVFDCQASLMDSDEGGKARAWLHSRGLWDETLWASGLGYNPADVYESRETWGLPSAQNKSGMPKRVWLPRGITIPWMIDGELWGVRIRRPKSDPKYYWIPGGTANALYMADTIAPGDPAVLVEGEIDALTIRQCAGYLTAVVATGSTHSARRAKWLARLANCTDVLIAYDADKAGDEAAAYWTGALKNARRWRPYWADANDMVRAGVNVRTWVEHGLGVIREPETSVHG